MIGSETRCEDTIEGINPRVIPFDMYYAVLICYRFRYDLFGHTEATF